MRRRRQLGPSDLARFERFGLVTEALRPAVHESALECAHWREVLGGPDGSELSPMRRSLLEDAARLGVVLRGLLQRVLEGQLDALDAASTLATLTNARRANLSAAGLSERRAEHDLGDYQAALAAAEARERAEREAREAAQRGEIATEAEVMDAPDRERGSGANLRREGETR